MVASRRRKAEGEQLMLTVAKKKTGQLPKEWIPTVKLKAFDEKAQVYLHQKAYQDEPRVFYLPATDGPYRLTISEPTEVRESSIAFELKDIPLPR